MKIFVLYGIFLLAGSMGELASKEERPRVLCGRNLADARMLYCFSTENSQKRSPNAPVLSMFPQIDEELQLPWVTRRSQQQALALESRSKRMPGLVDECCLKACYISELLNYC